MRSTSKMAIKNKPQPENNYSPEHTPHQYNHSPSHTKQKLYIKQDEFVRYSDSQLEREGILRLKNKRNNHLCALLQSQKIARSKQRAENHEQVDNNLGYIGQINALERKKRARIYFLKRKEQFEGSYKIGVRTKKGVQEQTNKLEDTEQTKSTHQGNIEMQSCTNEQLDLEEMHYEMVRIQQRAKQITKK